MGLTASTVLRGLSPARTILFLMMRLGSVNTLMVPTEKVALPSNYGVQCPNTIGELRFGAETDCRAFFTCSVHTKYHPRLAGCPMGTVFNDQKLFCDEPKNVPKCV